MSVFNDQIQALESIGSMIQEEIEHLTVLEKIDRLTFELHQLQPVLRKTFERLLARVMYNQDLSDYNQLCNVYALLHGRGRTEQDVVRMRHIDVLMME